MKRLMTILAASAIGMATLTSTAFAQHAHKSSGGGGHHSSSGHASSGGHHSSSGSHTSGHHTPSHPGGMHVPSHPVTNHSGGSSGHSEGKPVQSNNAKSNANLGNHASSGKSTNAGHASLVAKGKNQTSMAGSSKGNNSAGALKPKQGSGSKLAGKSGKGGKKNLTKDDLKKIDKIVGRIMNGISDKLLLGALLRLTEGDGLTPAQSLCVTRYLDSPDCPLEMSEVTLLRSAMETSEESTGGETAGLAKQTARYLKVRNDTNERMKVHVQFALPGLEGRWLTYNMEPGEEAILNSAEGRVAAGSVRIWAESRTNMWDDYKDQDLVLVEEAYSGDEVEIYTLPFSA